MAVHTDVQFRSVPNTQPEVGETKVTEAGSKSFDTVDGPGPCWALVGGEVGGVVVVGLVLLDPRTVGGVCVWPRRPSPIELGPVWSLVPPVGERSCQAVTPPTIATNATTLKSAVK